jgi:adenylate cyclase
MEFTAIGDTVNLASRLETKSKELDEDIVLSEYTYIAARSRFQFKPLGAVNVKGRGEAISVYTVMGENPQPESRPGSALAHALH